jgi:hypothetical protein
MTSTGKPSTIAATATATADPAAHKPGRRAPMALISGAFILLVLAIVGVLLVVKVTRGTTTVIPPPVTPAPGEVVQDMASVPASTWNIVGAPARQGPTPSVLTAQRPLSIGGKPAVVYVGAEFSPYAAAVRWALVLALSRFGTFAHLGATFSADSEVFAGIPTFSFDGASYRSRYLAFSGLEEYGPGLSTTAPAGFPLIHRPTALDLTLLRRYDDSLGPVAGLPFVDIDNKVVMAGAGIGLSPAVFQGLSMTQIGSELAIPTTPVAQGVVGEANEITAALCASTGGKPAPVCQSPGARAGAVRLGL